MGEPQNLQDLLQALEITKYQDPAVYGMITSYGVGAALLLLAALVIFAVSLARLAKKTKTKNAWFAWAPLGGLVVTVLTFWIILAGGTDFSAIATTMLPVFVGVVLVFLIVPQILNMVLMFNVAGMSGWWIFLFLLSAIPFAGWIFAVLFMVYIWMRISKAVKKPDFLGILMLIPLANMILPLYLAFSE